MIRVDVDPGCGREAVHALQMAALCGLVLSANGPVPWAFRAALAVLAGRALASRAIGADDRRRPGRTTILHMVVIWVATFSPVDLFGAPDLVRTGVVSAGLVLLVRDLTNRATVALMTAVLIAGIASADTPPHVGFLGEIAFALGASWPRNWSDVSSTAALFLLGSMWARTSDRTNGVRACVSPSVREAP